MTVIERIRTAVNSPAFAVETSGAVHYNSCFREHHRGRQNHSE